MKSLYCATCKRHTPHRDQVALYSTQCTICNALTSTLMRLQAQAGETTNDLRAPDGTPAHIVDDTPDTVTFHIPSGGHKGYYHYHKHTKRKEIWH